MWTFFNGGQVACTSTVQKNTVDFTVKCCKMRGNMPQYFTVSVKDSQILYFSQSILHAIVD